MPVDQATYRPYAGTRRPGKRVPLAIAGTMIRKMRRGRLVRVLVFSLPILCCGISVIVLTFWYSNPKLVPQMFRGQNLLLLLNRSVQDIASPFAMLLAALVGGPLIAEDRRAKALPLYFSRPISHLDYVLGKMFALFFFLGLMLIGAPVLMFLAEVFLNPAEGVFGTQLETLWYSLIPSFARIVSLSALVLGVSSLVRRANHAALLFFGILLPAQGLAQILSREVFRDPNWLAISPKACVDRITMEYLPSVSERWIHTWNLDIVAAWTGIALWTAAGLTVLTLRIRKVEVVS